MISIIYIYNNLGTLKGLSAGISFLSCLAGVKLLEMNHKRDFFLFTLIMELLLIGQLLGEDSIAIIIYIFFVTFLIFYMISCVNSESQKIKFLELERLKVTLKIFLSSVPLIVALYFLFPRLSIGNLFPLSTEKRSKVGFSDEVRPGDISRIVQSNDIIFRVKFKGQGPARKDLYFRGSVLTNNKGLTWSRKKISKGHLYYFGDKDQFQYDIVFDHLQSSYIFSLENTKKIKRKSNGLILRREGRSWEFIPYNGQKIRYEGITSNVTPIKMDQKLKKKYLKFPDNISPKVISFAKKMNSNVSSTEELLEKYKNFILKNDFVYTLSPGRYHPISAVEEFLFERRRGFCEHYASLIGLLLRMNGVPSRLIAGFQGGEYNEIGKYYIIRSKDAHAWVEAYDFKKGWIRVDPTSWIAPSRIEFGATDYHSLENLPDGVSEDAFLKNLRKNLLTKLWKTFDMAYYELNSQFLSFDYDEQKRIFQKINIKIKRPFQMMIYLFIALSCFFIIFFLWSRRNEKRPSQIDKEYHFLLKALKKRGVTIRPSQGPLSIKNELDEELADYDALVKILMIFNTVKYQRHKNEYDFKLIKKLIREL